MEIWRGEAEIQVPIVKAFAELEAEVEALFRRGHAGVWVRDQGFAQ